MNRSILSHRQRIDALFSKISVIPDPASQSEWAKYLCVLVSGFIEESLRVLLEEYARNNASPKIQNYVSPKLSRITNCSNNKIKDILREFDPNWEHAFDAQIAARSTRADEIKNSIDSVVTNRHSIAHGRNTGIRYATISTYYGNVKTAVEILEVIIQ